MAKEIQQATDNSVTVAYVDQGCTGETAEQAAKQHGIEFHVVSLKQRRASSCYHVAGLSNFAWVSRFRRLARDYERLPKTLQGLHLLAFAILMLRKVAQLLWQSA